MTLEDEINADLLIDVTSLATEAANNPVKHFKYLRALKEQKHKLKLLENRLKLKTTDRFLYYIGKHATEVCETVFDKSELKLVLAGDKDLLTIESEMHVIRSKVELLEEVLRIFNQRGFAIKNIIDVRKMENGIS